METAEPGEKAMTKDTEIERIIKDIQKSGLPLEIKMSSILGADGWAVHNQEGYLDADENKWRTIDIMAHKSIEIPNSSAYSKLHFSLIIECKKSDKPWVFYVREKEGARTFAPLMACGLVKQEGKPWLHPLHMEKWVDFLHYYSPYSKTIAVIPYQPFKDRKQSDIFEATNQLIKALHYEMERTRDFFAHEEARESLAMFPKKQQQFVKTLCLFYPIIVFDGKLYELTYDAEKPKLSPSKYIQYLISYRSPRISDLFVMDVINPDFAEKYLKLINNEVTLLKEKVASLQFPSSPPQEQ
jgi:hypothetical protein